LIIFFLLVVQEVVAQSDTLHQVTTEQLRQAIVTYRQLKIYEERIIPAYDSLLREHKSLASSLQAKYELAISLYNNSDIVVNNLTKENALIEEKSQRNNALLKIFRKIIVIETVIIIILILII
jgi:hypothetical protein